MKCSSRSTRLFASTSLALVLATAPVIAGGSASDRAIADAIVKAVRLRLGDGATVVVSSLNGVRLAAGVTMADGATFVAAPEPAARLGRPVRFLLSDAQPGRRAVRVGEAVAVLDVTATVVTTTRAVARGEQLGDGDVVAAEAPIENAPLSAMLTLGDARGAVARRDISAGTVLTRADIAPQALVRAGDVVRAHARVSGIDIVGEMVAAESGNVGDVIRVVNPETKYASRARVEARGEVEVVNVR